VPPAGSGGANVSGTHVCPPGALLPPSSSALPSVIAIGDSVSEGYEPVLAAALAASAFVQHSPHSDGGGADDVAHGLDCQENFLRTATYQEANWTAITFNFGLHNLDNSSAAESAYEAALTNFTARLLRTGSRLLYISTTPQMQQQWYGNNAVTDLNAIAKRVTAAAGVPYADLYCAFRGGAGRAATRQATRALCPGPGTARAQDRASHAFSHLCSAPRPYAAHITARCGERYYTCDICDDESAGWPKNAPAGAICGFHYTPSGYAYIVDFLAPFVKALVA
jgi:lysophospholipase L1-like esterase